MSTYYESAEDVMISKARALKELDDHCCEEIEQFFEDLGDHEEYDAQEVLEWLGSVSYTHLTLPTKA